MSADNFLGIYQTKNGAFIGRSCWSECKGDSCDACSNAIVFTANSLLEAVTLAEKALEEDVFEYGYRFLNLKENEEEKIECTLGSDNSNTNEPNVSYRLEDTVSVGTPRVILSCAISVDELSFPNQKDDFCPYCGSIAIIHFTSNGYHRCLRCLRGWTGCHIGVGRTREKRLASINSANKERE